MAKRLFFVNGRTQKRFQVLKKFERDGKVMLLLKGEGKEFDEVYNKERFERLQYSLVSEEIEEVSS